jgi:hypothetical protein
MEELLQEKNFTQRRIRITPRELLYEESRWGKVNEIPIPFECVTKSITNQQVVNNYWLVIGLFFAYLGMLFLYGAFFDKEKDLTQGESLMTSLVMFMIAGAFGGLYQYTKEEFWKLRLTNGTYLFILKNMPSEEEVDEFIETIYARRDEYLIPVLGEINPRVNYETQLENLKYLQYLQVWEEKEYTAAKEKLDEACGQKPRAIGFGNHWQA